MPVDLAHRQLPLILRRKAKIIYDGLDLDFINNIETEKSKYPLITYGTRGMEPIRYFPEFIMQSRVLLDEFPDLTIEIGGKDEINYGGARPKEGSWQKWAEEKLRVYIEEGRVMFTGYKDYKDYIKWIKSSWLHVYYSMPYVMSWSLLEAAACGTQIAINNNFPCVEACQGRDNIWINNSFSAKELAKIWESVERNEKPPLVPNAILEQYSHGEQVLCGNRNPSYIDCQASFRAWMLVADGQVPTKH